FLTALLSFGQTVKVQSPRQEKLLNGLKTLVWSEPSADKVAVKIRIHNGSAFDPQNKEGVMALLAEVLFPNETVKEFFREDLGGSLEISSNYDYVQINATAKTDQFLTMLETVANAVTNPQIDKETTQKVRAAQIEKVKELEKNPAYIADRAAAKRLFGDFPYGRAQMGIAESLAKIDFADLLFAKERFLTSDNATVAISGNVKPELALRAIRRYFGSWIKADKKVPATFRQPDSPDTTVLTSKSLDENRSELRIAFRGLARNDKDFWASNVLTNILKKRHNGEVRQEARLLHGILLLGVSAQDIVEPSQATKVMIDSYFNQPIKEVEFVAAKNELLAEINKKDVAEIWLDVATYKLDSVKAELQAAQSTTVADVNRLIERFKKEPMVTVLMLRNKPTMTSSNN
ncbi:MAG: insulinase family protein, partial [Acidobacteriota bacterium]|nr:insulinase family protein [Acidobacteriota bacterium]